MIKRYSHVILKEILKNIKSIHNKRSKALDTSLNAECGTSRYWKALGDVEHYNREIEGYKADLKQLDDVSEWSSKLHQDRYKFVEKYRGVLREVDVELNGSIRIY
ncbi:DUF1140 family protein [Staphylococcus pseudintermedius]|uniref:DUF1140 family protein n=1 Tax=Staphylococcus pseudintermedius TaxID=283734 RepID=UPI000D726116|nr:DUF1140 family protein [Staphylococcus pseudintermedius]EGQ2704749.1 DUF1140 family protein [Staphylococcus pseudintermedius]EHD0645664.1 DUF1140 family protein [Staphylococcus pseudintermedius]EIM5200350.1 DUF1140 family protein [Staphylococcus pseudintermedius]EIQ3715380.1 DUF1140 family protein [Staphylococcus pseudintermedius]MCE5728888.1 DUF1140 family protein [Staphylococcus pseudintermedius]